MALFSGRGRVVVALLVLAFGLIWFNSSYSPHTPPTLSAQQSTQESAAKPAALQCCAAPEAPAAVEAAAQDLSGTAADPIFDEFDAWASQYNEALPAEELERGVKLATQRTKVVAKLISADPQSALKRAVPAATRKRLPQEVVSRLEERVQGHGSYAVVISTPENMGQSPQTHRYATVNGKTYRAHVYGRRTQLTSKNQIALHGIAVEGAMAVDASPVRLLEAGEELDPQVEVVNAGGKCPISGLPIANNIVALAGSRAYYLCSGGHILELEEQLAGEESGTNPDGGGVIAQSAWTTGTKSVLYIRINYPDDLTDPQSVSSCEAMFAASKTFFEENSYGATTWTWVITPLITMPQPKAYYAGSAGDGKILLEARAAAKAAGYDYLNFNLDCVRFQGAGGGYGGQAYVGARGCWMKSSSAGVLCHEIGHNYGLWHANYWTHTTENPIGTGSNGEYGDSFDTMGAANAGIYHFNAYEKSRLDWMLPANITTVTANGTYRITAFDQPVQAAGTIYALKVNKDSDRDYWLDFRQKFTSNKWLTSGVDLHWDPWASSNGGSQLIDTTPNSPDGKSDAAIVIGRTFSDPTANVHFTPIRKGGTTPESLDVVVNRGPFSGNVAPVVSISASATSVATGVAVNFSATASDGNGDTLAYYWDFGDRNFGPNATTTSKSWSTAGEYVVRCTVSDMKGKIGSDSVVIRVGSPTTQRVTGSVTSGGVAMVGVRVFVNSTLQTFTDSDGTYTLANIPAGSYTVSAGYPGYTFAASGFTNPVTPPATGVNFVGTVQTWSISGTITSGGAGVDGVTVSDGTRTATTNSTGAYTITGVPNGSYTLTATKTGYTFNPSGFTNPVGVADANVTTRNFITPVYSISGEVTGVGVSVTVTDGTRTTSTFKNGSRWLYTLSNVPAGKWNLRATLAGYVITPSFTNPVTVTNASLTNQNFSGVTGTAYSIAGTVTASGSGLQGVVVSDGTRNSTTDTLGRYYIANVPNGSYTLTPSKSGYSFTPATLAATVSGAALTGRDFVGNTGGNTAPTISNIADRTVNEDTSTGAVAFTVGDAETAAGSLTVSGASSNTTLVPAANIVFGGSGSSRTVTVTPAANQSGSATITVSVSDGTQSASDTFVLTVTGVNDGPTISNIADRTLNEDTSTGAVAFTVGDAETSAGSLTMSVGTTNNTLVPNANIVLGGSGSSRTVTVTPAANQTGTATIMITVSDGALSASDTFVLTVTAVNDTPTISNIADQNTNMNTATAAIPFTIGDVETATTSLTVSGSSSNLTLVPNANMVFGGSGSSRTVTVTPATGQTGTATITVTVSDGTATASDTFVLTVTSTNTAPTISNIADRTVNEDTSTGAVAFTVGDAETPTSLTVTGSSSNTTLVPNANIVFGGSGTSRTVTVTPAANQSGTATITVSVSDGALSASDTFVLTVTAVNDTPTISNIADRSIAQNTSTGAIAFTVGDVETAATSLTLSGNSSNLTLVPNANIVFGGSGSSRTVTVTPATGQTGTATITLTVSDGTATASDTFVLTVTSTNTAPTISNITDRTTNEDASTGAVAFTIGDTETAAVSLTVTGSSSNTTLVPNANIAFGGSGTSRTVTVTPAANQSGTATITVSVSDGALSASDTFVLTVAAVNDTPTISNITDRTVAEDTSTGAITFTVGDVETAAGSLTVSGSSSNLTLVPTANIVFGGSGSSRTVTVTPASNQTGTATITVTVSDGTATASDTFVLTVTGANDAPTITNITDRTINEDTSTGAIAFTIGDTETAAASLTVSGSSSNTTLVPNANIVFGGSGSSRTVTVTPAANAFGTATITVRVSDGSLTGTDTFVLTVTSVNDVPVANNQTATTMKRKAAAITLTASDVETTALTYSIVAAPTRGTLSGTAPNLTYTPSNGSTGTDAFTFRASDGTAFSNTATVNVTITKTAPTLASALTATPNPALVGESVSFPTAASDADGDTLAYRWSFGDGSTSAESNPAHIFTAPGVYTALLTISDEDEQSVFGNVTITVNSADGGGGGGGGGGKPGETVAMTVLKATGKVSFATSGRDSVSLTGVLPGMPAGFDPSGVSVTVNVGGAVVSFTLDGKGRDVSSQGSIALSLKPSIRNKVTRKSEFLGGDVTFKLVLKNGAWADDWADEGVEDADVSGKAMSLKAEILLNGTNYTSTLNTTYSGKKGKGGLFK